MTFVKGGLATGDGSFKIKLSLTIMNRKRSSKLLLKSSIFVREQKLFKLY